MKEKELNRKVQLLKDGQIVKIDGDNFRAIRIPDDSPHSPCEMCCIDSLCQGDILEVCTEMETLGSRHWYLDFAYS